MTRLVLFALVLFTGSCYGKSVRVLGGSETTIESYPWLVQVDLLNAWTGSWTQYCAGNILNEIYVLSVAHCFEGVLSPERRIRAGSTERNAGGDIVYINQVVTHPSYRVASRYDGDIALVRLSSFLVFGPTIQQGGIPAPNSAIPDNSVVSHAGWGHMNFEGPYSNTLLETSFRTINNDFCRLRYESLSSTAVVTEDMICTGVPGDGGVDHCQGDSGGGVYFGEAIIGIASWGYRCGDPDYPGVSIAVSSYTTWIVENLR